MAKLIETGYICKEMWQADDWRSFVVYRSYDAAAAKHAECGVARVQIVRSDERDCTAPARAEPSS